MMLKPDIPVLLSATFHDKPVITMALRHYHFLTVTIKRLKKEIEQQTIEQQSTFGKLICQWRFHNHITPIVADYRQQVPTTTLSSSSSPSSKSNSKGDSVYHGTDNYSTEHSPLVAIVKDNPSSSSTQPSGSQQDPIDDPIDVDAINKNAYDNKKTQPEFKLTCKHCGKFGHEKANCDTLMWSFVHWDICEWMGWQWRYCDHYDLSPVAAQKLWGNIPYDNSN